MKKLLMFAAAMTIVGGAFADIRAYDYKASVKNVNIKTYSAKVDEGKITFYIKYVESSSLYGYLINACTDCDIDQDNTAPDNGQGFLVVANKRTVKAYGPKILPADLVAKWWNPKIVDAKKVMAQGYLFAGNGKKAVPFQDDDTPVYYNFGDGTAVAGGATRFLFGDYNDFNDLGNFFDCWLDAAGFGTAVNASDVAGHCGPGTTGCIELDTLSGSVIGGLWLCYINGYTHSALVDQEEDIGYMQDEHLCTGWAGTSDVISGTWSIKRNTKFVPSTAYTATDLTRMVALNLAAPVLGYSDMDMYVDAAAKKIKADFGLIDTSITDYTADGLYETPQNGLVNILFATVAGADGTGYQAVEN